MVENLFSVVLFFSFGYLFRKSGIFRENDADVLIKFIIYVSFPALVVYNIYHLQISSSVFWIVVSGWAVIIFSIILSFLAGRLLHLSRPALASFVMMSSFGNTSFLGFPFQLALLGEEGLRYAVIFDQLASFYLFLYCLLFILSYGQGKIPA
ncbi:MAG: AEC family transporter [Persephonella sp.]|nr:AEC family transporter [Persephonella sp.]